MTVDRQPLGLLTRVVLAILAVGSASAGTTLVLARLGLRDLVVTLLVASLLATAGTAVAWAACGSMAASLRALHDGLLSFAEQDFSVRLRAGRSDAVGAITERFNQLGQVLRAERSDLYQKEQMLETVLEAAPLGVLLFEQGTSTGDARVAYSNGAARDLFAQGRRLEGETVKAVLATQAPEMRAVIAGAEDGLFAVERRGERETFHAAVRHFELRARPHTLVLVKPLTREVTRREALAYKSAIRVLSHELSNSLAPISSLVHSARKIAEGDPSPARLARVFETVEERVSHLTRFLESYARLAKLPRPERRTVRWRDFLGGLRELYPFDLRGDVPSGAATFDAAQMQQVAINLLKNATEAGSQPEDVELEIVTTHEGFQLWVLDRGAGMTDEVLAQAMLPFYSTKQTGTGLGLALCREIVEAHGGELSVHRRESGGIAVCCGVPEPKASPQAPLES